MYRKHIIPEFRPTREEMLRLIEEWVQPVEATEQAPFMDSLDRVCAADVFAGRTLPNTSVTRLDGIGVRFADFAGGIPDTSAWREGREFYFANTGMALREGFDTEIIIEDVDWEDGVLTVHKGPGKRGEHIAPAGGFMVEGELLVGRWQRIGPAHLSLLAAGGVMAVEVLRRPRVAILPTGNELVPPGQPVPPGRNVESNGAMLAGYLRQWGAEAELAAVIPDSPNRLHEALTGALARCDAAIVIAGSSLGTEDYTAEVLARVGTILAPELAHGPGRKSSLAVAGGKPVLGIAGPPMGAQVAAELYLRPVVDRMLGQPIHRYEVLEAVAGEDFPAYEVDFVERLRLTGEEGDYRAVSSMDHGSTRARQVAGTHAFLYHTAGRAYPKGAGMAVELIVPREAIPREEGEKENQPD